MIIKHFDKNKDGKIEFTETELKALLDEVYNQGKRDGQDNGGFYWSSPWVNSPYCSLPTSISNITTTTATLNDCINNQLKNED